MSYLPALLMDGPSPSLLRSNENSSYARDRFLVRYGVTFSRSQASSCRKCECNIVVNIEAVNNCDEKVLQGTAEVSKLKTVYVFTGQGSQEQGMGMDLYTSSSAVRAIWDGAGAYILVMYDFLFAT